MPGHGASPLHDVADELLFARRSSGPHGRGDAAAGRGDLLVGLAAQPAVELRLTVPGKGKMGVRIDKAGNRRRPSAVEVFINSNGVIALRSDISEPSVANDDDGIVVHRELAHRGAADAGRSDRSSDLREVPDE